MEIKKNPKSNLENYSKLFMQLGLVLALFVTYVAIENKTYDKTYGDLGEVTMASEIEEETIELTIEPPKPKQNTPPPPAPDKIEVVEDEKEVEETVIESTETDESEAVEVEDIEEVEEEEEVVEDVPFSIIEEVPIFPGCTGSKAEKKACLNKKLQKHVQRNFDAELANELGLAPGKKRIYVQFKIDKDGSITSVNARAPHPRLKKEAIRVAKKIPKMKPGRQRGRAVRVGYTLPITFNVE
ncbi:energy transducer TonB [Tenacibaculum finnmarkense genomovar finnmarkense]|uniref:energy transducer TonB n=1 Tax=Tenacibaculum finnmarkense TaxID=2781243 RepID=UPI000C3F90D2|nr:energy transducer TonB [Tenacibaculum finnmarkense]MBE7660200.1 energy transducer TonB [Tenacibaculum finnmarkense genomovar finnmarkense]MBE7692044.1 energy transducer TonB [Tenacibaculum finnmarkense genomovar finnmarkense]MCD8402440.1 energy transducer TonB [Tenacibaculum finnmarkense genomovar finnmarkense]MCD8413080.1 energy transducer TonB [Tenacibaculum finnmarkense genomovar ulcerans]MCD8416785.1 energy transducer TonB [Tenacibaculum finnmarkense genomovar finnmarkense]